MGTDSAFYRNRHIYQTSCYEEEVNEEKNVEDIITNFNSETFCEEIIIKKNNYIEKLSKFNLSKKNLNKIKCSFFSKNMNFDMMETDFKQNEIKCIKRMIKITRLNDQEIKLFIKNSSVNGNINYYKKYKKTISYSNGTTNITYNEVKSNIDKNNLDRIKNFVENKVNQLLLN